MFTKNFVMIKNNYRKYSFLSYLFMIKQMNITQF